MPVIQDNPTIGGTAGLLAQGILFPNKRLAESSNQPLVSLNSSQALVSGGLNVGAFDKLVLFVSVGPSNVTIKTLDGNSVTLSNLATNTNLTLDVQFSQVTWTGTATAVGYYTE